MPDEICPFCKYRPRTYEAMVTHVRRRHCPGFSSMTCFCGVFFVCEGNSTLHQHFHQHGGLHAHAQDFLMGVTAKEKE